MPQYTILIYEDEAAYATPDVVGQVLQAHNEFIQENGAVLRGGSGLESNDTATSLRTDSTGGFLVTDGAFGETKEALGGYYIVEVADLDEAIAVAKQVRPATGASRSAP